MRRARPAAALLAFTVAIATPAVAVPRFLPIVARGPGNAADRPPAQPASLPALPLATGAKLMVFCDSHSAFNNSLAGSGTLAAPATAKGLLEAAWQADPRFNFDSWYDSSDPWRRSVNGSTGVDMNGANQGIPGDHLAQGGVAGGGALRRLRYALSRAPDMMLVNCGTNSISTGDVSGSAAPASAAYVTAQLDAILTANAQHGVWTILSTLYPRGDWPAGDRRHQITRDVNAWIRAQSGRAGIAGILDPYDALVSPGETDTVRASLFLDRVHLAPGGVALVNDGYLLPILRRVIAPGRVFNTDPTASNLFPATTYGMPGTGGTRTGATGPVATGFTLKLTRSSGGSALIAGKDAGNATLNGETVTVTPGGGAGWDQAQLQFPTLPVTTASVPAGSWVRGYVRVTAADAASAGNVALGITVLDGSGATKVSAQAGLVESAVYSGATAAAQAGRGTYWLATKPFRMPADGAYASIATAVTLNWWAAAYGPAGAAAPFTVKIDQPILRLSADPRPAWNLP